MLKIVFVLGCLLSFALAHPTDMEHKRLARSRSGSHSNERIYWPGMVNNPSVATVPQWFQAILALLQQTTTAAPATTTTTTK
ncbi:hypothetical protein PFLUV_G00009720 [Perca fluviatilis]|uniref:Uncharacterized protein n=1 Tax=Perca fluviatilis TaxID=8168 RepID=A0A6A5FR22_PERFL|nr:hypothetical protein PFLUV_G00009720 [Perca fluviatilis]